MIKNLLAAGAMVCAITAPSFVLAQDSDEPERTTRCERRAFEVNDFGKEGPISLAKQDIKNYTKKIKKREGVSRVRVSQKKPTCRLYLWLGPASEYTCRIEASFCWDVGS